MLQALTLVVVGNIVWSKTNDMRKLLTIIATLVATMTQAQGVIDVHSHIITPEFVSALDKEGRLLDEGFPLPKWDAEAQLKWMDEAGIATSVLTLAAPQPTSAKVVRATNEAAAKLKREHPDRFRFCAALPLPDVAAAIEDPHGEPDGHENLPEALAQGEADGDDQQ